MARGKGRESPNASRANAFCRDPPVAPALPFVGTRPPQPGPDEREAQDKHRLSAQAMERSHKATFVG